MCTSSPRRSAWRSGEPYCRQDKSSGRDVRPASRPRRARPRRLSHGRGPVARRPAPPSTPARVKTIARLARGFIYLVSLTGVTGERRELPKDLDAQIRTLRLLTTKPVCVGFGVSTPDQVAAVAAAADGVAVGSAIVRKIEEYTATPTLIEKVGDFIATL